MELDSKVQTSADHQGKTKEDIRVYSGRDITKSWFRVHIAVDCNQIGSENK